MIDIVNRESALGAVAESAPESDAVAVQAETNQTELAVSPSPVTPAVADHLEPASVLNCDTADQAGMPEKQSGLSLPAMATISTYLSKEPDVLKTLCEVAPPIVALGIFESTLAEQQLQCFQYCYEKGYCLEQDASFLSWSKLKSDCDKQRAELPNDGNELDLSLTSLPDLTAYVRTDLDVSLEDIVSTFQMDHLTLTGKSASRPLSERQEQAPCALTDNEDQSNKDNLTPSVDHSAVLLLPETSSACQNQSADVETTKSVACGEGTSTWNTPDFPFRNSSFPGDSDSDVLPYPTRVLRKKKTTAKEKYFLLTSKEARDTKLKEIQEKELRERSKAERAQKRIQKLAEMEKTKVLKNTSPAGVAKHGKCNAENRNTRRTRKQKDTMKKSQKKPTMSANHLDKTSEADSTPCGVCGVVYCHDNSGRNWIECSGCKTWYHNACQGLGENESSAFLCISCDF